MLSSEWPIHMAKLEWIQDPAHKVERVLTSFARSRYSEAFTVSIVGSAASWA